MTKPLNKNIINKRLELTNQIIDRIDYIASKIIKLAKNKINYEVDKYSLEEELRNVNNYSDDYLSIITFKNIKKNDWNNLLIKYNDEVIELYSFFPYKWLFEPFEDKLIAGRKEFEAQELAEAVARKKEADERASKYREATKQKKAILKKIQNKIKKNLGLTLEEAKLVEISIRDN